MGVLLNWCSFALFGRVFAGPVVKTSLGSIEGRSLAPLADVDVFFGIRYGVSSRFQRAEFAPAWAPHTLNATELGPICFQGDGGLRPNSSWQVESEDCLLLNLWRPSAAHKSSALPVMVWIHGGGFTQGSGAGGGATRTGGWTDGTALAKNGVLVVTINYRSLPSSPPRPLHRPL